MENIQLKFRADVHFYILDMQEERELLSTENKQECGERVKRNICRNGGLKRKEKKSIRQNKLEPCVNRVYRNQIWPVLKVIYRENAFSRVH